ncbi:MAG: acyl-CoA reductase [Arachidicoccus sp.]|nr:acyl-CoA reductase [Arachidicoccus sp.]
MNLQQRINVSAKLGNYLLENNDEWQSVKQKAFQSNAWFIPEFIDKACINIAKQYLDIKNLQSWAVKYQIPETCANVRTVGIIMAGNIPLVGFHDFLCAFISGHRQHIKLSSKDNILLPFLIEKMIEWEPEIAGIVSFAEMLKNCDAYIATGSNNSGRYFEYYFGKYPSIIRRNKTSAAILTGKETKEELQLLANDIVMYFGLGCRNVTKLYVPENYDFIPLLNVLKRFDYFLDYHKYKHNFDYQLALLIMSNKYYMNSGAVIFTENESLFSPISVVNYSFYNDENELLSLKENDDVQCLVGNGYVTFGETQEPLLDDYADGIDTMQFLIYLK